MVIRFTVALFLWIFSHQSINASILKKVRKNAAERLQNKDKGQPYKAV